MTTQSLDEGSARPSGLLDDDAGLPKDAFPYETIKFSGRLKIIDPETRRARFVRRQRVRFLEDGIGVFFDRIWGDGVLFAGYFAPGLRIMDPIPTRKGYVIPLGLPRTFNKGEVFDIVTERNIVAAFYHPIGYWEMSTQVPTDVLTMTVVTPAEVEVQRPEITAPARGDLDAVQRPQSLRFRVGQPALNIPYRLAWSWK